MVKQCYCCGHRGSDYHLVYFEETFVYLCSDCVHLSYEQKEDVE